MYKQSLYDWMDRHHLKVRQCSVMEALIEEVDDTLKVTIDFPTLAQKAYCCKKTVSTAIRELEQLGMVHRKTRAYHKNTYTLMMKEERNGRA